MAGCSVVPPDYQLLAEEVLNNTPEHLHFAPGASFSFVVYAGPVNQSIPGFSEMIRGELKKNYTVYSNLAEVPEGKKSIEDDYLMGLKDGFQFWVEYRELSPSKVKISYKDWEGNLAASSHYKIYKWTGRKWKILKESPLMVS